MDQEKNFVEYKKCKKEGKGTEYHSSGSILFQGEYKEVKKMEQKRI